MRLRHPSHFLLGRQEKVTKEKATLLGACRAAPGKSVSRGRAFRQCIHALAKRHRHPCRCPCGPVVHGSPPHKGGEIKSKGKGKSHSHSYSQSDGDGSGNNCDYGLSFSNSIGIDMDNNTKAMVIA